MVVVCGHNLVMMGFLPVVEKISSVWICAYWVLPFLMSFSAKMDFALSVTMKLQEKAIGEDGLGVGDQMRAGMSSNADEVGEEGMGPDLSIEKDGDDLGVTIDYQSQRRCSLTSVDHRTAVQGKGSITAGPLSYASSLAGPLSYAAVCRGVCSYHQERQRHSDRKAISAALIARMADPHHRRPDLYFLCIPDGKSSSTMPMNCHFIATVGKKLISAKKLVKNGRTHQAQIHMQPIFSTTGRKPITKSWSYTTTISITKNCMPPLAKIEPH
ncbi:hypothetical protein ACLOJK_014103 [Asimina triloba]